MNQIRLYFLFSALLAILSYCSIPEVKETKPKRIVLASDFLFPKDSLLLRKFEKKTNLTLVIKNMSTDSIQAHFKKWKYNSKIDVVLLSSSSLANQLTNAKVLNILPDNIVEKHSPLISYNKDWIAIGINPYVFDYGDSIPKKNSFYQNLTKSANWTTSLNKGELSAFYASVSNHFGKSKKQESQEWIRKMMLNLEENKKDLKNIPVYSLNTFQKTHLANANYSIPNQNDYGCFYDGYCIGIIKNSKNYFWAEKLVRYFLVENNNEVLTWKLNLFPFFNPKGRSSFEFQNNFPTLHWSSMKKTSKKFNDSDYLIKILQTQIDTTNVSIKKPTAQRPIIRATPSVEPIP